MPLATQGIVMRAIVVSTPRRSWIRCRRIAAIANQITSERDRLNAFGEISQRVGSMKPENCGMKAGTLLL